MIRMIRTSKSYKDEGKETPTDKVLQLGNTNYLEAFIQALGRKQASEIVHGCCIFHGRR